MKACADVDRNWYVVDGQTFQCSNHDCSSAAQDVADYCTNGGGSSYGDSESDSSSRCSVARPAAPGPSGGGAPLALVAAAAGLALARRSRRA
jgi:hypothetical protein